MRNNWLWFMDLDGESPYIFPVDPLALHSFGDNVCSQISLLMDNSFHQFRHLSVPGSLAIEGAFNHITKLAGALLFVFSGRSSLNMMREIGGNSHGSKPRRFRYRSQVNHITSNRQNFKRFCFSFGSKGEFGMPVLFGKISCFVSKLLHREAKRLQSHSILSLAAALIPPFDNLSKVLGGSLDSTDVMVQRPCEVARKGYAGLYFPELDWRRHEVEPRTGIEFPMILDNVLAGENNSNLCSELLVGTGSRAMTIVYLKSLKVYAFGFYVHPPSVCEKLGPKYASFSFDELNNRQGFYEDLLRQDIDMTVRLVVSCNGLKINTVKDAFEKSLRTRLLKANPETDFQCIRTFGSCFTQDIPLPAGTTIDFRRTADGQLITEIEGKQIGAVRSKDLCRAFFSMYIGDIPVSEQTKEEIGRNVANIVRRC